MQGVNEHMKLWNKLKAAGLRMRDDSQAQCYLCLTGEPPQNASERLVLRLVRGHESPQLTWLVQQICAALYQQELRLGASALDIGILGPSAFSKDATRILSEIRPDFAYLVGDNTEAGRVKI